MGGKRAQQLARLAGSHGRGQGTEENERETNPEGQAALKRFAISGQEGEEEQANAFHHETKDHQDQ